MKKQIYFLCLLGMIVIPLIALANADQGAPPSQSSPPPMPQNAPAPNDQQHPPPSPPEQQGQQQPQPSPQNQQPQPPPPPQAAPPQQSPPQSQNNQPPAPGGDQEMNACQADLKEFCPKIKKEKKQIACLQENRSKVITACLKVVDNKLRIEKEEAEKRRNGGK